MKILQFGTGVFLRGFFDWMVQDLKNKNLSDASVTMVKLTPHGNLDRYKAQNGNYHVVIRGLLKSKEINELQEISCLENFIHPYEEWDNFLKSAEDPHYKLVVSNSTEAGLTYEKTKSFTTCPSSFPAKLYSWLKARNESKNSPVSIMACELVPDNSSKLKEILLNHAADDNNTEIADFIENCEFINTLVDRIVSKVPEQEIAELKKEWNVNDDLMLCAEPYHFLAVDSDSLENILPLKEAGLNIEVTKDLDAVRERKVKVLNGAHMLVVPAGLGLGHEIVAETLENPALRSFAESCLDEEISVTVSDPKIAEYVASVIERFENPFLNHRLEKTALNSSAKIGQRLFPSIKDYFEESGRMPQKLLTAVAIFLEISKGELIEPGVVKTSWGLLKDNPEAIDFLIELNCLKNTEAAARIAEKQFWPVDNNMKDMFISELSVVIKKVREDGIEKCLS